MNLTKADVDRFNEKYKQVKKDECWNWEGNIAQGGYGMFSIRRPDIRRKTWSAHRIAWMIQNQQDIPEGMMICHKCDNRRCVNPNHLYAGTGSDNNRDTVIRNRGNRKIEEQCSWSKLTTDDVLYILNSSEKQVNLAKQFNIDPSLVSQIKSGKRWNHLHQKTA